MKVVVNLSKEDTDNYDVVAYLHSSSPGIIPVCDLIVFKIQMISDQLSCTRKSLRGKKYNLIVKAMVKVQSYCCMRCACCYEYKSPVV
jgi:hypothetical protein